MSRHRHRRFRIACLTILALLMQQVALAAYACNLPQPALPMPSTAASEACTMGMAHASPPSALCHKHCTPDRVVTTDHAMPTVPPLALPPPAFELAPASPMLQLAVQADVALRRSDPPPRLRYCSLLI